MKEPVPVTGSSFVEASNELTLGFTYNPASQIASATRLNDIFLFTGHTDGSLLTPVNGRNRITSITDDESSETTSYDLRSNMTGDGTSDYSYTSQNQLTGRREPGSAATVAANPSLTYDPLGRLYRYTASGVVRRFGYDGDAMIAEYTSTNLVSRRYVHGVGVDQPLVQYDGAGTATRRWLHADERGSIVARSDDNGAVDHVNTYDEYGVPGEGNVGRFGYTGQVWLPELGLYYYRARIYNPELGRFMQADPIGYRAGLNLYAYVGGDPVNARDPSGLQSCWTFPGERGQMTLQCDTVEPDIVVSCDRACRASIIYAEIYFQYWMNPLGNGMWYNSSPSWSVTGLLQREHDYISGPNLICPSRCGCSQDQISSLYSQQRFSIPGSTSADAVESGGQYNVYLPGDVYIGDVRSYVGEDGLTVANVTIMGHLLHDGFINRAAYQGADGHWYSQTHGKGTNYIGGLFNATANQF